ncbi:MAG: type III pantothenate kinase [Verrucomicrobiae bacterium]|nr:type III pantothenate kinase [Verrucomicrobiae bacterium]
MKAINLTSNIALDEQWLVADLSNSTCKFALTTPQRILTTRRLATADLSLQTLSTIIEGWSVQRVIIASVVPKATQRITRFCKNKKLPLLSIDATTDLGIKIRYPNPSSIGADRLVNVVAVKNRYPTPCIVANFGTAIVFDIIDQQGTYLGGIIAPGLFTSSRALHERTALLPLAIPSPIRRALGKNTLTAIHSGLLLGARGLVREVVEQITKETFSGKRPSVIGTGTDAQLVAGKENFFDHIDLNLTLEGIREVGLRILETEGKKRMATKNPKKSKKKALLNF